MSMWWQLAALGLFKSCISSIFPFSFCIGRMSLFRPQRSVYSGTAGIVRYRPVSWAVHFEGVSVPIHQQVWRIPTVPTGTVRCWLPCFYLVRLNDFAFSFFLSHASTFLYSLWYLSSLFSTESFQCKR